MSLALAGLVIPAALAGCGGPSATPTITVTAAATATAPSMHRFGEAVPAGDVSMTVAAPVRVTSTKDSVSSCRAKPRAVLRVLFRITNTSRRPWSTGNLLAGASSGGHAACPVWEQRDMAQDPAVILPSRTGTMAREFGVDDPSKPLSVLADGATRLWWTNDPQQLRAAHK